ncbi:pyridine nucleotide-disulfide oxidoreductase [Alcanivorax sp. HI0033]|uniref:NAD(P)/FAD-dependent oxidoreductase n=1 Tax=unclassified Alcanivorax TaxID=2638842 RepID=UPI0007B9E717|nr:MULTISPECIES: FAD-dependent oxidoreductase [unclassified Alcanivorax]KZX83039.1 pyridine nucleotide-disulfide oxidoreductase [Alcanivorax sp. HI0011]KZX89447.1 pyridine nucleotide-disulfide oxidoreductase [Alcanivorax sp. HI0013]KZY08104.1 pyridine nucleotide-disulfide oxidoreductase [Alcanivorax sp. HI0035]KZX66807.1 pyridine nucleotide-disulfide oxidoreductase [Alcanivorax sp. HI0003]KZX67437.1 pyridine nucleotide-disulfide oxidoreductase [Alcanivorax sp. HI0007]
MQPIVIIGSGLAGFNTVKEFRKLDKDTPIVMLTSDDGRNYSKPMLSAGFTKEKTADDLCMATPEKVAEQFNVEVRTDVHVAEIDPSGKRVLLPDDHLDYSKLVLALGADTWTPPLEGDAVGDVFSVNDLMDYGKFRTALQGAKKVTILGGGLIGCEFANDLSNGGYAVTLVEPQGRCLPLLLPEPASAAVGRGLADLGVTFHFGPLAQAVNHGDNNQLVTELSDGTRIESDVVLSAIGLRPRIALAKEAGLAINRGIVTDKTLKTSAEDIYALGDCAEVQGHVLPYVLPLMASARALAKTLAGETTAVSYGVMPVTIKTPACPVVVCPPADAENGEWEIQEDGNNVQALFRGKDGSLQGYALTGDAVKEKMKLNKELPPLMP